MFKTSIKLCLLLLALPLNDAQANDVYFCEVKAIAVLENDGPPKTATNTGERIKFSYRDNEVKFSEDSWYFKGGTLPVSDGSNATSWVSVQKGGTTDFVSGIFSHASTNVINSVSFRAKCDLF